MAIDAARAKSLFLAASDLSDPLERASYLDRECADNAELRGRVDALLCANEASPWTGESPPEATNTCITDSGPQLDDGEQFTARIGSILGGKYKLIEAIGEGGMGSVYMAQQIEPVKRAVAVKVIKQGMDSKAVLARFEAERQALAMMDHPNIARVLDAGTTDLGSPYFVMELVKGMPITEYCDEHRLTTRQRLELFVPVCHAIQHAHQKGIIHRDIKPSNVLIAMYDDKPVPKVIDFGVAKAAGQSLTDKTLMTAFGALVGTPEYMSPEQANLNNLDIDTRSDVYSLGVLLFELLTGSTPVDRKSLGKAALLEVLRIVREVDAPKPSHKLSTSDALPSVAASRGTEPARLTSLMKGELDWVVLKALEKDRMRRYESANGLAVDLQRYLADDVVEARPPSTGYKIRKFARRNRGTVVAVSLVILALLAGIAGTSIGLLRAQEQRRLAEAAQRAEAEMAEGEREAKQDAEEESQKARRQADIAESVKLFLERDLITQANPLDRDGSDTKPDPDLKLKTALDRAVTKIAKRFEGKPLIEASIRHTIGKAYTGRGLFREAQQQLEIACQLYRTVVTRADRGEIEILVREPYLEAHLELINLYLSQSQTSQAQAMIQSLQDQFGRVLDSPEAERIRDTLARLREIVEGKNVTEALQANREMMHKLLNGSSPELPPTVKSGRNAEAGAMTAFGRLEKLTAALNLMRQGKLPEAEHALSQITDAGRAAGGTELATVLPLLAEVYRMQGKYTEAAANYEAGRDAIKKTMGEDHPSLGACYYGLTQTYLSEQKYAEAEAEGRSTLNFYERRFPEDLIRFEITGLLGAALIGQMKYSAAEPLLQAAVDQLQQQEAKVPNTVRPLLRTTIDQLIEIYTKTNQPENLAKWQAEREKYPTAIPPQNK